MKYSLTLLGLAAISSAQEFTSIFNITATPDQVVNAMSQPAPGQPGAKGQFNYAINSKTETICYDITLENVSGVPQSPARTATHIHEGAVGRNGPPRIAFPNPVGDDKIRRSVGCLTGPFTTGLRGADNVTDTGAGFKLAQIEANPAGFFTDSHTNLFVPGVVRGQLSQSFKIIDGNDDGAVITTATLTKTQEVTLTKCPPEKTECPYASKPVVTKTAIVYTTVCPVSELPYYTKTYAPHGNYTKPAEKTYPAVETTTKPNGAVTTITKPAVVTLPVETPIYSTKPDGAVTIVNVPVGTGAPVPTGSSPVVYQGAAAVKQVGGIVAAMGVVVAALL